MSEPHEAFAEATERDEALKEGRSMLVPLLAAIIAVLAALGTLFAHGRSISALSYKNEAILTQARASDAYNYYESKRIKFHVYSAFVAMMDDSNPRRKPMKRIADKEQRDALPLVAQAKELEKLASEQQEHAEKILKSFETLEVATTLFEISIVFVSISALAQTRVLLYLGCVMSTVGVVYGVIGYLQA